MDVVSDTKVVMSYQCFDSINKIDAFEWDAVVPKATGLKHNVLRVFEQSGVNDLICHYMLFNKNTALSGKANLYETSMDFFSLDKEVTENTKNIIKQWHPNFLNLSMIECGLFAMNGDGLVVKNTSDLPQVISLIDHQLNHLAAKKNMDLLVFRDVPLEHYAYYEDYLTPLGYAPVTGFTNAVIDINWKSLDSYFNSLRSKERHKLKSAFNIEKKFDIKMEVTSNYKHLAKDMADLWRNVNASSNDYNREQLNEAFFYESGLLLKNNSEVILYFHKDRLVAFMWNLIGDEDYHMADWGVDYQFPEYRAANFYRAASVHSLQRAIDLGKKRMQLGMTNYTPKKLLGAKMQPLVYFIKHRKNPDFSPVVAHMMTQAIEQPQELNYYHCDNWPLSVMSAQQYKDIITTKLHHYSVNDPFFCTEKNHETNLLKMGGLYSFYPDTDVINTALSRSQFFNYGKHPSVIGVGVNALKQMGAGADGAAFFAGYSGYITTLQEKIAQLLGQKESQIVCSGSIVHNAALPPLLEPDTLVFMDEQNNPSLWEVVKSANSEICVYEHNNMRQLENKLQESAGKKRLIVTEAVFSLFGDCAELQAIVQLKHQYAARVYLDCSHDLTLFEEQSEQKRALCDIDIIVASTLPSLGIDGGFIAGPESVINYIRHQSTALLFSSVVSNANACMLIAALDLAKQNTINRSNLSKKTNHLVEKLMQYQFQVIHNQLPVINIVFDDFMLALAVQKKLLNEGLTVVCIGPPLLPPPMSVIRLSLHDDISVNQIEKIVDHFKAISAVIHA